MICTKCKGDGGYTLDCGCVYDCSRCLGTGIEPPKQELAERERLAMYRKQSIFVAAWIKQELAERERLAIEDAALEAAGVKLDNPPR